MGTILVLYSGMRGVVVWSVESAVLFVVSIFAGALIYTSIKLFFASFSFWIKRSGPFLQFAYELADFAKYPTDIYARGIRFVITWVIPFAFVAYLPASYFLGVAGRSGGIIAVECAIAVIFWLIAYGVFRKGLQRYESAGN